MKFKILSNSPELGLPAGWLWRPVPPYCTHQGSGSSRTRVLTRAAGTSWTSFGSVGASSWLRLRRSAAPHCFALVRYSRRRVNNSGWISCSSNHRVSTRSNLRGFLSRASSFGCRLSSWVRVRRRLIWSCCRRWGFFVCLEGLWGGCEGWWGGFGGCWIYLSPTPGCCRSLGFLSRFGFLWRVNKRFIIYLFEYLFIQNNIKYWFSLFG